ncbi:MAG: hypothetical protein ACHQ4G_11160 [Opitutales bacterium]
MNPKDKIWQRLVAAARLAADDRDMAAPYGFATRVVAQAWSERRLARSLVERFSLQALGVSCLVAVIGVLTSFSGLTRAKTVSADDAYFITDDPAAIVLDVSTNE